jgi:hypothetical protein
VDRLGYIKQRLASRLAFCPEAFVKQSRRSAESRGGHNAVAVREGGIASSFMTIIRNGGSSDLG